jgi:hypothetical protein
MNELGGTELRALDLISLFDRGPREFKDLIYTKHTVKMHCQVLTLASIKYVSLLVPLTVANLSYTMLCLVGFAGL